MEISGEFFLDELEYACDIQDRYAIAELAQAAFTLKDLDLQAITRAADNYVLFLKQGNVKAALDTQKEVLRLVSKVRGKMFLVKVSK